MTTYKCDVCGVDLDSPLPIGVTVSEKDIKISNMIGWMTLPTPSKTYEFCGRKCLKEWANSEDRIPKPTETAEMPAVS